MPFPGVKGSGSAGGVLVPELTEIIVSSVGGSLFARFHITANVTLKLVVMK